MLHLLAFELLGHQGPGQARVPATMEAEHHRPSTSSQVHIETAPAGASLAGVMKRMTANRCSNGEVQVLRSSTLCSHVLDQSAVLIPFDVQECEGLLFISVKLHALCCGQQTALVMSTGTFAAAL